MKKLMVVVAAALCCAAFAQGPEGGRPEGGPRRGFAPHGGGMMMNPMMDPIVRMVNNPKFAEKIGLTDEQKAKLKELNKAPARGEEQSKMRDAMKRQAQLLSADKIDEAAVMATIDEVFELRKQTAKAQVKRVIAVKSVLTPEQVKKAKEEMSKRFEARGDKGERAKRHAGPREGGRRREGGEKGDAKPAAEAK